MIKDTLQRTRGRIQSGCERQNLSLRHHETRELGTEQSLAQDTHVDRPRLHLHRPHARAPNVQGFVSAEDRAGPRLDDQGIEVSRSVAWDTKLLDQQPTQLIPDPPHHPILGGSVPLDRVRISRQRSAVDESRTYDCRGLYDCFQLSLALASGLRFGDVAAQQDVIASVGVANVPDGQLSG